MESIMLPKNPKMFLKNKPVLGMLLAATAALANAAPAQAHERPGRDRDARGGIELRIELGNRPAPTVWSAPAPVARRVWVEPVYRQVEQRVWVEASYRSVQQRVWVEAPLQTIEENVWVPDRYEVRESTAWYGGRRVTERCSVLVDPAHYETRARQVACGEGQWQVIEQQELVSPAHWEVVCRPELVSPGHWEASYERPDRFSYVQPFDRPWRR